MEIKDVQLEYTEVEGHEPTEGFVITYEDDSQVTVSTLDQLNRHFLEVQSWYAEQETKPFDFAFPPVEEPVFAETIYPEPEETDETESVEVEPEQPVVAEEPETLMPK